MWIIALCWPDGLAAVDEAAGTMLLPGRFRHRVAGKPFRDRPAPHPRLRSLPAFDGSLIPVTVQPWPAGRRIPRAGREKEHPRPFGKMLFYSERTGGFSVPASDSRMRWSPRVVTAQIRDPASEMPGGNRATRQRAGPPMAAAARRIIFAGGVRGTGPRA